MEKRKILVIDPATNAKVTLMTDATTFGELKKALKESGANININGKDWLEGLTQTTPRSDDSVLPVNVPYKGQITNNLVFLLSNTNKKTASGAVASKPSRKELGDLVNKYGIGEMLKKKYGKNWTNLSSSILVDETNKASKKSSKKSSQNVAEDFHSQMTESAKVPVDTEEKAPAKEEQKPLPEQPKEEPVTEAEQIDYKSKYEDLVLRLAKVAKVLEDTFTDEIMAAAKQIEDAPKVVDVDFSEEDLNAMRNRY